MSGGDDTDDENIVVGAADARDEPELPRGPGVACLDAMVLLLFHDHGHFAELGQLFADGAYTADVILEDEIGGTPVRNAKNAAIIAAPWLHKAPVLTGQDAALVNTLLRIWGSPPRKDRGEAEIIALCKRHGWVAITDDARSGRPELDSRGCEFSYVISMLVYAAATGRAGMDATSAWQISQNIQADRNRPYVPEFRKFEILVKAAEKTWESRGKPGWPQVLADWKIDHLVDRSDRRHPPRRARS